MTSDLSAQEEKRKLKSYSSIVATCFFLFIIITQFSSNQQNDVDENNETPTYKLNNDNFESYSLPARIKHQLNQNDIIGSSKLTQVKRNQIRLSEEPRYLQEYISNYINFEDETKPLPIPSIIKFFNYFISELGQIIEEREGEWEAVELWDEYQRLVLKTLYPWDQVYLKRMPERRLDDTIFLSLVSYRDKYCSVTLLEALEKADHPEKISIGLVQQNCVENCKAPVNGSRRSTPPDQDCYKEVCASPIGRPLCEQNRIQPLLIKEHESLGPYVARFFASKFWQGETWFLQIDSHMGWLEGWDTVCVNMLKNSPTEKPVISHYPPPHYANLTEKVNMPGARLCGPVISKTANEGEITRFLIEAYYDKVQLKQPRFAPVAGAGFFLAHSGLLKEVPFDPFLPWIFMGEELILSARLWTHGYDIYSPTQPVTTHRYKRLDQPKFWEIMSRLLGSQSFNNIGLHVLSRIKYQMSYPESAQDFIWHKSLFAGLKDYTLGTKRTIEDYLEYCGLNFTEKIVYHIDWCNKGLAPKGFEKYAYLYEGLDEEEDKKDEKEEEKKSKEKEIKEDQDDDDDVKE